MCNVTTKNHKSLGIIAEVELPRRQAMQPLSCPFCPQVRSAQAWLSNCFECNCGEGEVPANALQTFRIDSNGAVVSCTLRQFWDIYDAAQELYATGEARKALGEPVHSALWHWFRRVVEHTLKTCLSFGPVSSKRHATA